MKRILVLCRRDWCSPRAGRAEEYVREVFSRVAGRGHYVALVSQNTLRLPLVQPSMPSIERVDGVQVVRLGVFPFHRFMLGLLFNRLRDARRLITKFDVVVDCVYATSRLEPGKPFPVSEYVETPVVPLVFDLAPRFHACPDVPGPAIAATGHARAALEQAGFPSGLVINIPHGVDPVLASGLLSQPVSSPTTDNSPFPGIVIVAEDAKPARLRKIVDALNREGGPLSLRIPGSPRSRRGTPVKEDPEHLFETAAQERAAAYHRADIGCCGIGREWRAPAMAACGLPVVCPATDAGKEFVIDGTTGLLYDPGDVAALKQHVARLAKDDVLRKRLGAGARGRALAHTWGTAADMMLAVLESPRMTGTPRQHTPT